MADNEPDTTRTDAGRTRTDDLPELPADEEGWRQRLTPEQYRVARQGGTEPAFTGAYWDSKAAGTYRCVACDAPLFSSTTKYDSGTGWPSFWEPLAGDSVILREDRGLGMVRTEVLCATCHSHLGHVFEGEGYGTPTDQRYCINSISLRLVPSE